MPFRRLAHPILGTMVLWGSKQLGLRALTYDEAPPADEAPSDDTLLAEVAEALEAYLLGEMVDFRQFPLRPQGTPFQQKVWGVLQQIGWGQTQSYGWVAQQLGMPRGSRAIGQANGRNPIPIIIPCHRVIAHDGSLGGYTGGLHIKSFLLSLESHVPVMQRHLDFSDPMLHLRNQAIMLI